MVDNRIVDFLEAVARRIRGRDDKTVDDADDGRDYGDEHRDRTLPDVRPRSLRSQAIIVDFNKYRAAREAAEDRAED